MTDWVVVMAALLVSASVALGVMMTLWFKDDDDLVPVVIWPDGETYGKKHWVKTEGKER